MGRNREEPNVGRSSAIKPSVSGVAMQLQASDISLDRYVDFTTNATTRRPPRAELRSLHHHQG
ncbi:hypothetical protein D3C71_577750 [compost metagenome]